MIQVIAGDKGSGKTKKMISLANECLTDSKGHVIFLSNTSEAMYELNSSIRLINTSEFPISSIDSFVGFIYGIISEDYDVEYAYIDNINCIGKEEGIMLKFVEALRGISEKYKIKFVLGVKAEKRMLPDLEIEYIAV
jgi:chromosomal replication initiation ATPase DnaA